MFIVDHYNYLRWLPVLLNEMANLHKSHSAIHEEKTNRKFSKITRDHNHQQMNAKIKGSEV